MRLENFFLNQSLTESFNLLFLFVSLLSRSWTILEVMMSMEVVCHDDANVQEPYSEGETVSLSLAMKSFLISLPKVRCAKPFKCIIA